MQNAAMENEPAPWVSDCKQRYWDRRARQLKRRLNLGWVLELVRIPLMVFGFCAALILAAMRRGGVGEWGCAVLFLAALIGVLGFGVWSARPFWVSLDKAFARLDVAMGWNSRLSAARQGVGTWPEPPQSTVGSGAEWRWGRVMSPWILLAVLSSTAFWVPRRAAHAGRESVERPPSLQEAEELLAELEQNAVLAPENFEVFKDQLEQLKSKPQSEWYSHHALEAASQLKAEVESGARMAVEQLTRLEEALEAPGGADSGSQQFSEMQDRLRDALEGIASSPVGLDPQLASRLKELASRNGTDPLDWRDLQERLCKARECCGKCLKAGFKRVTEHPTGNPVVTEDGGSQVDLQFGATPTDLGTAVGESLPEADLSKALPGDAVQERRLAPKAEDSSRVVSPEAASVRQSSAHAVWTQRPLPPAEQRRLRTFYGN